MALELKQSLRMSQRIIMTPQLQQAIKFLQLSRLELCQMINQEMEVNPLLEEAPAGEGMEENPRSYRRWPRYFAYYSFREMKNHLSCFEILDKQRYPMKIFKDEIMQLWLRKL